MLQPVFKKGIEKGVTDYVAENFRFLVSDMLTASDATATKKAIAKFKKSVEATNKSYKEAIEIVD